MSTEQSLSETTLRVEREIAAPVEKVYEAWTNPEIMFQWMGPGEVGCKKVDIDLKQGGKYLIHMVSPDCENHVAIGEYKEITPNKRLQFTWSWEGGEVTDTLVTVDFETVGDSTKVTLLHENFPTKEAAEKHTQGWNGCLEGLANYLSKS